MGGGGGSRLRKAARKMVTACGSFSRRQSLVDPVLGDTSADATIATATAAISSSPKWGGNVSENAADEAESCNALLTKNLCAICLDPLSYSTGTSPGPAIFTAQCSHAFHFACISSNVRHGSVTCPICRAHWTQLPRNLNPPPCSLAGNQTDPILRILDDSIANFRVHRRSFLRSARYDDDDPIEPDHSPNHPRVHLSLIPLPLTHPTFHPYTLNSAFSYLSPLQNLTSSSSLLPTPEHYTATGQTLYHRAYLSVKLAHQQATDLVLVASPNGPHLRLLKQSMALVVFSLRPVDRLAIVTYSSAAARVFPLRRMTSYGKRTALQVIDRLFYMGQADPIEGLKKGIKILEDRAHKNPQSCILHLSDSPTRSYHAMNMQVPIPIHRFHVGFGFGASNGFVMHEFEEFLARLLGGVIRDIQLRIGDDGRIIRLGELRGGEERRIPLDMGDCEHVCVGYSYVEGGIDDCIRTGETVVCAEDKTETSESAEVGGGDVSLGGRTSSVESWDYHDPYMARRWAKHLHGYRL
ncbi:hypothetical protein CK203_080022 [Vitis vinifera]|uniref:RING-type domain-containing protein n=1 Tax=Vitis vinifera TaxID=29760 RepID=A0A438DDS8_VITVI|nr:hypothetical protein CK203_080022 [Vitis vinifera]